MAGVTDIYKQGLGEASLLPQKDYSSEYEELYLQSERKKQKQEQEADTALSKLANINQTAWEIDEPDYTKRLSDAKTGLAEQLATGKLSIPQLSLAIDRDIVPIIEEKKASSLQRKDFINAMKTAYGDKSGKFDIQQANKNFEIYKNPKKEAVTNPVVAKQLEELGGNVVKWRAAYGTNLLNAPIRYDEPAFRNEWYGKIEELPSISVSKYIDPTTGKLVETKTRSLNPNIQGIADTYSLIANAAALGDPQAIKHLEARASSINKNFEIKEGEAPVPKGSYGKEIWETAKKYFKEELQNPYNIPQVLAKAEDVLIESNKQKRRIDTTSKYIAQNRDLQDITDLSAQFDGFGGALNYIQRLGGQNAKQTITPIGDRTGGSETFYRRAMDNVVVNTPMSPRVYNATTGQMESSSETLPVILSGRGVEYVYKEGTKINGVDVGGSVVPQYNWIKYKDKIEPKIMAQGTVKRKNAEGDDVVNTVFIPYDLVQNGFISQVQGGDAKKTEELTYDDALLYGLDEQSKALKRLGKSTTPTTGQSANQKQTPSKSPGILTTEEFKKLSPKQRVEFKKSGGKIK